MTSNVPSGDRISVIIPVFDRSARLLDEAIDSALAQTLPPAEIVVIDDGSAEPVAARLEAKYGAGLILLRQDNLGIGPARNAAIAAASGEYLAFLDSDDVWLTDKLEVQHDAFVDDPTLEAVYGKAEQFYDVETDDEYRQRHPILQTVIDAWISTGVLIRRAAFDRVGPFADQSQSVDIDWGARAKAAGLHSVMLDRVVYRRRLHTSNLGLTRNEEGNPALLKALREHLHRQRGEA